MKNFVNLELRIKRKYLHQLGYATLENNLLDDAWFGTEGIFNTENADKTWTSVPKGQIHIPDNYDWKQYVKLQRLEMACGEAPYLVKQI